MLAAVIWHPQCCINSMSRHRGCALYLASASTSYAPRLTEHVPPCTPHLPEILCLTCTVLQAQEVATQAAQQHQEALQAAEYAWEDRR